MKVVIQRVFSANVRVENEIRGEIKQGFLLYVCFEIGDQMNSIDSAIKKIISLRIFEDANGRMNKNILEVNGEVLSISQFTLSWDGRKGNRPSFDLSMSPEQAKLFYHLFNQNMQKSGVKIQTGIFGADMKVESINDGPVTFHLSF